MRSDMRHLLIVAAVFTAFVLLSCNLLSQTGTPIPIYIIQSTLTSTPTITLPATKNGTVTATAMPANQQPQPAPTVTPPSDDISGIWVTDSGQEVRITKGLENRMAVAAFINNSDGDCPNGGHRDNYLEGALTGSEWSGTLYLCTRLKEMVVDCGLASVFIRDFTAAIALNKINGTYTSEWYDQDTNASGSCKWVRNPSGDHSVSFSLTRKN